MSEPDLFDDLPPPSGPRIPEPSEAEVAAAIEQTIDDDDFRQWGPASPALDDFEKTG